MILFYLTLRFVLIPGTIFFRKVQNPTYFWVPIVWDLDCVNRTRDGPSTSCDAIVDCTHVPGPLDNTRSLRSEVVWREVVWRWELQD